MKMISVDERLPEKFKTVLLISKYSDEFEPDMVVGFYHGHGFSVQDDGLEVQAECGGFITINMNITHWAEITFEE